MDAARRAQVPRNNRLLNISSTARAAAKRNSSARTATPLRTAGPRPAFDATRSFATRMRALGGAIALDDFGVGHGTFTYLRHLPVDYLKIDMQFVRNLLSDPDDRQVVQAIVGVAGQFGIETIAEGVEDEDTPWLGVG